jgi:hypothetical protein
MDRHIHGYNMMIHNLESTASPTAIDAGRNQHDVTPAPHEGSAEGGFLHRLPADLVSTLQEIPKWRGSNPFDVSLQRILADFLQPIEELVRLGATHEQLSRVLAEVGVRAPGGGCLSRGTISKALSRARQEKASDSRRHGAALAGTTRHDPADGGLARLTAAPADTPWHDPAASGNSGPVAASSGAERQPPSAHPMAQPPQPDEEKTAFARQGSARLKALRTSDGDFE